MNTKLLLTTSALLMAAGGLCLQFAPHEVLTYGGNPAIGITPVLVQLLGALYLGFALLNWMSKAVLMGGIYARPLAIGNLAHFTVGALTLLRYASTTPKAGGIWALTLGYALLALLFGVVIFTHPLSKMPHEQG